MSSDFKMAISLPPRTITQKVFDPELVMVWIIGSWLCLILYFDPRLLGITLAAPHSVAVISIVLVVLCLDSFWFYMIYHAAMITMAWWARHFRPYPPLPTLTSFPRVAILYATRNDFREPSIQTCLDLDYPNFHLFILDDSTLADYKERVDRWVAQHPGKVTLIRRGTPEGFKAGNLNHAMRLLKDEYPYFAICDADDFWPKNFVHVLLPHLEQDLQVGFVQAKQEVNPNQKDLFAQAIGYRTNVHYRHFVRARLYHGFVMFYGHGAIIRTSAWEKIGGFPEIVSEDLAFSSKIREFGFRGVFEERMVCYEDFPPTHGQLRTRTEKWIRGTTEYLKVGFPSLLRSPNVPWYEKVDVFVNALMHHQLAVMLVFLLTLGIILPLTMTYFEFPGSFLLWPVPTGKTVFEYLIHIRHHMLWSLDFYIVMILTMVVPLIPVAIDWRKSPGKVLRFLAISHFIYLSSLLVESIGIIVYLVTGKAFFWNTYDAAHLRPTKITSYHPNHPMVWVMEVVLATLFAVMGFVTRNLWFLAPAIALYLSPLLHRVGWESRWLRWLTYLPCAIGLFVLGIVTLDLIVNWINNYRLF